MEELDDNIIEQTSTEPTDQPIEKPASGPQGEEAAQDKGVTKEQEEYEEKKEALEALKKFTDEDDMGELSLRAIFGGDILQSRFIINQVVFVMFCVLLMLLYTGNRYSSQQDAIVIDSLRNRLTDVKYNVLTQSSELMNITRQSNVEKALKHTKDSALAEPTTPPYLIKADSLSY